MTKPIRRRRPKGKGIRNRRFMVKANDEEMAKIDAGATAMGLSRGAYVVHMALLGAPKIPASS